jgi:hypothetical protein
MKRGVARAVGWIAFLGIVLYLAGGVDGLRYIRARIKAAMEPPTADQMMRAPAEPPPSLPGGLPREAVRGKLWLSDPPRPVRVAIVIPSIVAATMLVMYFTGRPRTR